MSRRAQASDVNDALVSSASRGALFWVITIAAVLASAATVIGLIVVLVDREDADVEACREADRIVLSMGAPTSSDQVGGMATSRQEVASATRIARPDGDVDRALRSWLEAIDQSIVVQNDAGADPADRVDAFQALIESAHAVDATCDSLGVQIGQRSTAPDGTISAYDARLFCDAARSIAVTTIDTETISDQQLTADVQVMSKRMSKGLPSDVYEAAAALLAKFVVASVYAQEVAGRAEASSAVGAYCATVDGAETWPIQ